MRGKWIFLRLLLLRLGIVSLLYTALRVLFFVLNNQHFNDAPFISFVGGIRFDVAAIILLNIPVIILHLIPLPWRHTPVYQGITKTTFYLCNIPGYLLACIDLVFFGFTLKRSTADLFDMLMLGNDFEMILPSLLLDYWNIVLIFLLLIGVTEFLYKKTQRIDLPVLPFLRSLPLQTLLFAATLFLFGVLARGGIQLTPINVLIAGNYGGSKHSPLVLNTPFTIMQTLGKQILPQPEYYSEEELNKIFNTVRQYNNGARIGEYSNVVIILLESFSSEYIGAISGLKSYTPFLDSLFQHGLLYSNAYANGHRSIEALPSIISSIPPLMNDPYVISNYSGNKIGGLAEILSEEGYSSSFYHGGKNGTMAFDDYCKVAGFDDYFGLDEYPNEGDFDGTWGISDDPYFQYFAKQMQEQQEPFFSCLFSLSSHHPYKLPKKYNGRFKEGELPIHRTIQYTDMALSRFFHTASKMSWFQNTLFVITSDHTAQHATARYNNPVGSYSVPIFFFQPGSDLVARDSRIFQQIDIMPTILDLIGYEKPFYAFGSSPFSTSQDRWAVGYYSEVYQLIQDEHVVRFDGTKSIALYELNDWSWKYNIKLSEQEKIVKMERKLKAIIQQFNNDMISNQLSLD